MFSRKQQKPSGANRYDMPPAKGVTAAAMSAQIASRPPVDAFWELLREGHVPPGYVWPIAFCQQPLAHWDARNIGKYVTAAAQPGVQEKIEDRMRASLATLVIGQEVEGADLLNMQVEFSLTLVGRLAAMSFALLSSNPAIGVALESWKPWGADGELLQECVTPEAANLMALVKSDFKWQDLRVGGEVDHTAPTFAFWRWNPNNPLDVFNATLRLLGDQAMATAARLVAPPEPLR